MASDEVEAIINEVQALTEADPNIARIWVRDAWRRVLNARRWSFLHRRTQLICPTAITDASTGAKANFNQNSDIVTFTLPIASDTMIGMQLRSGTGQFQPVYDVIERINSSSVRIYPSWPDVNQAAVAFTIMKLYMELPADCQQLISVVNPTIPRSLRLNYQREVLDGKDPMRTRTGTGAPALLCPLDWSLAPSGRVKAPVRVIGSGAKPTSSGIYTGPADALFTIQITTGGIGAAAIFKWAKDEGAYTTGVQAATGGQGNALADGVHVLFDPIATYNNGDTHIIRALAAFTPGRARHEIYPAPSTFTILPTVYVMLYADITDDGVEVPGLFQGRLDVVKEKALEFAASVPQTKYSQISLRDYHAGNSLVLQRQLELTDNLVMQRDALLSFPPLAALPWEYGDPQTVDPLGTYPGGDDYVIF